MKNKIRGRDYNENELQKRLWGKPKHFKSAYTKKNNKDFKGCFGECKYLISGGS